eukprot:COSAG03_NODE_577_length_6882_cov_5.570691_3_plen_61_part_00
MRREGTDEGVIAFVLVMSTHQRTTALAQEQSGAAAAVASAVFFFFRIRFRGGLGFRGMVS